MRYLAQFLIPISIMVVVYLLMRNRTRTRGSENAAGDSESSTGSDTGGFVLILIIGGTVAVLTMLFLQEFWN